MTTSAQFSLPSHPLITQICYLCPAITSRHAEKIQHYWHLPPPKHYMADVSDKFKQVLKEQWPA
jgi:hypothetical protein